MPPPPQPRRETSSITRINGRDEIYATNLGIYYERVAYQDGTFGVRLTRDAVPNTPAGSIQLEAGDTIYALDGMRFRTSNDVLAHTGATTVDFINIRTNGSQSGAFTIP